MFISTCVPWMTIETKFSKLCVICSLNEHLYAQLSKVALWLVLHVNHEMTFVCFNIAKVECQILNIIGYFFSISYMLMHGLLKRKRMQRTTKSKKNQNDLYMITSVYSKRCESYRMYLEGDSSHQTVMIVCELK